MRDIFWICLRRAHRHPWSINVHRRPPGLSQRSISLRSSPMRQGSLGRMTLHTLQCRPDVQNMRAATRGPDVKLGTCKPCCNILYSRTNFITTAFATKRPRFQDYQIPGCVPATGMKIRRKASRYVKICTTGILPMTGPLKSLEYV